MGYQNWPWPQQGTEKWGTKFWRTLKPHNSIAKRVRRVELIGDVIILGAIGFLAMKVYNNGDSLYVHRNSALTCQPPALVAQNFDFSNPNDNRTLSREKLQEYKDELAAARKSGSKGSEIAFKY
eukprot:TRINITY_DN725_c2_g1_i1.p1 TRINITY_DN725_c2_g1~~TRINITY_DN725_c2_g1_i1.p1  ORF type:complete len:137 (+),score=36.92 TRINITY_DN725_c2_g1_i1:40-411(+)